jgi:hypothetical protein
MGEAISGVEREGLGEDRRPPPKPHPLPKTNMSQLFEICNYSDDQAVLKSANSVRPPSTNRVWPVM